MDTMDKYLGTLLDGRYELLEVIGTGGMAVVYRALDHRLGRYVAVKILKDDLARDPEFRRRFQTESQAVAMLSHPNIVSVYDVSKGDGQEYIVMELIEGITLKQYMKQSGALGWRDALHFATQIARALDHAHSRGIIHRDIKPHNIMIDENGVAKVADFGIARLQDTQNTMTQFALGSVHYISPEQAKGEPVDARTDIYSLGIVMYEMLTGQLPFEGDSAVSVAVAHISSIPAMPRELNPDIPPELEAITMRAMDPDLNERYASAAELLGDLEEFGRTQDAIESGILVPVPPTAADMNVFAGQEQYKVRQGVKPLSRSGELSAENYRRSRFRSRKVSFLLGVGIVLAAILVALAFVYQYWVKELFSDPQRILLPNFVGSYAEDVTGNPDFKGVYVFTVVTENSDQDQGLIIGQSPEAGKSLMVTSDGIPVELQVSAGLQSIEVPDVANADYREAEKTLTGLGFVVDLETIASDTVTKDYVVNTDPAARTMLASGATVKLYVSGGPDIQTFPMPDLVGMTQEQARQVIESNNLALGEINSVDSDQPAGRVVWQSIDPNTQVQEHDKVFLNISLGPTAPPSPSESPPVETPPAESPPVGESPAGPAVSPEPPTEATEPVTQ